MEKSRPRRCLLILVLSSLVLPTFFTFLPAEAIPSRGTEEDIRITIGVEFVGMTHYHLHIDVDIRAITMDNETFDVEELRDHYSLQPDDTVIMLEDELRDRMEDLTSDSFNGDELLLELSSVETVSLEWDENVSTPVEYTMEISGEINISRYLDADIVANLDPGRLDIFILGMLMSGFEFTRTVTLRAGTGQVVDYLFPSGWDPLGDGQVQVILGASGSSPIDGYHVRSLDSKEGEFVDHFTFKLMADPDTMETEEVIEGAMEIDWFQLDSMDINGWIDLGPLSFDRSGALDGLPPSMNVPPTLSPGFIRFSFGEGVLSDEDLEDLERQVSDEVEGSLSNKFDGKDVNISSELVLEEYTEPVSGLTLVGILSNLSPNRVSVRTVSPIDLDILEEHTMDDVVGLLNGGLRIKREMEYMTDNRLSLTITLPEDLVFMDENPVSSSGNRNTYDYSGGYKTLGSDLAPVYDSERVEMDALIDLTNVRSLYVSDMEIDVEMNGSIYIHRIRFDPQDYDVRTDLDYELDYLTSDLIRILDRMGMVNRSDVEDEVREKVTNIVSGLLADDGREISVSLSEDSMEFDGDLSTVNDDLPISIEIKANGVTAPLAGNDASTSMSYMGSRFLPPHLEPMVPVRTITKTIDTRDIMDWDSHLRVRFPSGSGIRAWIGEGNEDRVSELEVKVDDGYPTLLVTPEDEAGDHITLELTVGTYFAFNNITACFFSATAVIILIILLIVILIIRRIIKRKRSGSPGKSEGEEIDLNGPVNDGTGSDRDPIDKDGQLNW
ncbi:MAG: hypothetical protein JXA22_07590 [Candidatus Thermoplasmatota archaeon]|nr:hypothetical protein [Candidatus Thermoplasmatota archaeon]